MAAEMSDFCAVKFEIDNQDAGTRVRYQRILMCGILLARAWVPIGEGCHVFFDNGTIG